MEEAFLSGPKAGYCSDSDEEKEDKACCEASCSTAPSLPNGPNTGPKGVLADYEMHQQKLDAERRLRNIKINKQANAMSLDRPLNSGQEEEGAEGEDELEKIRQKRLEQLKRMSSRKIVEIPDSTAFLEVIEKSGSSHVFIHIYREDLDSTKTLNEAMLELGAAKFPTAKLYKIKADTLGTSGNFRSNALPALQVYKNELLLGSFIRITDSLGEDFDSKDLVRFLASNGIVER